MVGLLCHRRCSIAGVVHVTSGIEMSAQRGYIVASMGQPRHVGALKGRAWRKVVYGRVGVVESADQVAGAKVVLQRTYADATRVGVWGWSNGGSMTLSLLFRSPEIYGRVWRCRR